MELKEFVTESLGQIIAGVREAQKAAGKEGNMINPGFLSTESGTRIPDGLLVASTGSTGWVISVVNFDVAVRVTDGKSSSGKASLSIFSVGADGEMKRENSSSSVSRIQFNVPVALPVHAG